jgi:hypothetical protein
VLACPVKWDAIHCANRVDKSPVRANVTVFKRDMVGSRASPPIFSTAALVKVFPLHHKLGQPGYAIRDASRFV